MRQVTFLYGSIRSYISYADYTDEYDTIREDTITVTDTVTDTGNSTTN